MLITIALFVWVLGLILWASQSTRPLVSEVGKIMFTVGLLVWLLEWGGRVIVPLSR